MRDISTARLSIFFAEAVQSHYKNMSQMDKLVAQSLYFKFSNAAVATHDLDSEARECWHLANLNMYAEDVKFYSSGDNSLWRVKYSIDVDDFVVLFICTVSDNDVLDIELEVVEEDSEIKDIYEYYISRIASAVT
jgi:hypothetical protein